jgi:hypothetical protein
MHVLAGLFARRHAAMRAADPTLAPLPDRVYLAIALGIRELIHDALESEAEPRLRELEPDVELLVRSVVEGAAAARRSSSA